MEIRAGTFRRSLLRRTESSTKYFCVQVPLDDPDVGSFVDQSVTATVPEHVRVNLKMLQTGLPSDLVDHQPDRTT